MAHQTIGLGWVQTAGTTTWASSEVHINPAGEPGSPLSALPMVFMNGLCVTGGYLVPGHHGNRDDRRRTSLLQRATTAGHAPNPG